MTDLLAVFLHPLASVPITEYVPVESTTIEFVDSPPGLHSYVAAPVAVKVTLPPIQNVVGPLAVIATGGREYTVTDWEAVFLQPFASVPVTVNVPDEITDIEAVV